MTTRREMFGTTVLGGLAMTTGALGNPMPPNLTVSESSSVRLPQLELALEIVADVAEAQDLGPGPLGIRRIVPILGGSFEGRGPLGSGMRGKVLPGGADRQLIRTDGVRQLSALYELQTDDGAVITVLNRVLVENYPQGGRYAFSTPEITAPKGKYDWLNHAVFVGTLDSLRPARMAVSVRFFRVF